MVKKSDIKAGKDNAVSKLESMGNTLLTEIEKEQSPSFEAPLRGRSNVFHNEKTGCLYLGEKKEKRFFLNVAQAKKFMQTVAVASKCKKFKEENLHTSIRGLFYQLKFTLGDDIDEELFEEQSESNELVEDLEVSLAVKREELNLNTARKGVVAGPIRIKDKFAGDETIIDGTKQGRSGWMIPSDVDNGMELLDVDADYVLVVEKDAMWQRLNEDKFWKDHNCIIITGKGQPARGCRRLINRLHTEFKLPVYVLADADPWGYYIFSVIKQGSINLSFLSDRLGTPEAKFIGLTTEDLHDFEIPQNVTIKLTKEDEKRIKELQQYVWFKPKEWQKELSHMAKSGFKLELEALSAKGIKFVSQVYLPKKINEGLFLP